MWMASLSNMSDFELDVTSGTGPVRRGFSRLRRRRKSPEIHYIDRILVLIIRRDRPVSIPTERDGRQRS